MTTTITCPTQTNDPSRDNRSPTSSQQLPTDIHVESYVYGGQEPCQPPVESVELPVFEKVRCCCGDVCRRLRTYTDNLATPFYGVDGLHLPHSPKEGIRQTRLRKRQLESIVYTPTTLYDVSSPVTPTDFDQVHGVIHANLTGPDVFQYPVAYFEPDQRHPRNYGDELPTNFDKFVTSQFEPESSSVRDVGLVSSTVIIQNELSNRASSYVAEVSNMSTPELVQDSNCDDSERSGEDKYSFDAFARSNDPDFLTGADAVTHERDDLVTQSTNFKTEYADNARAVDKAEQNIDMRRSCMTEDAGHGAIMPRGNEPFEEDSLKSHSPQIKQECYNEDKENILPISHKHATQSIIFPSFVRSDSNIHTTTDNHAQQIIGAHMNNDVGTPQNLKGMTLGVPKDSSIVKRRTKDDTLNALRPSRQFLPTTTYISSPRQDIASFFRRNNRFTSVEVETPSLAAFRISKRPIHGDLPKIKKRKARESFDLVDLCRENQDREIYKNENRASFELVALCRENTMREFSASKRRGSFDLVELCHENTLRTREAAHKKARLNSIPATPISARLPPTPTSTISSNFQGSPMATALSGYPGQFEVENPQSQTGTMKHVFGNHLHPNGEIINLNFTPDVSPSNHLDISTLSTSTTTGNLDLTLVLTHATHHSHLAESTPRTTEEDSLRVEAHRECAAARLEGVTVGYYRYFQGHMTVEEYNEARMCVCWGGCWCCALCTRFGDLACPCAGGLVVGEEI